MNATLVEIQRIQTRLQRLGRSQGGTTSPPSTPAEKNSPFVPSVDLPEASQDAAQQSSVQLLHSSHRQVIRTPTIAAASSPQACRSLSDRELSASPAVTDLEPHTASHSPNHSSPSIDAVIEVFRQSSQKRTGAPPTLNGGRLITQPSERRTDDCPASDGLQSHGVFLNDEWMNDDALSSEQPLLTTDGYNAREAIAPKSRTREQISATVLESEEHHQLLNHQTPNHHLSPHRDVHRQQEDSIVGSRRKTTDHHQQAFDGRSQVTQQAASLTMTFQQLNAQAQHVNAIANTLQVAMADMKAIAQTLEHQRALAAAIGESMPLANVDCFLECRDQTFVVPFVSQSENGALVVEGMPIDGIDPRSDMERSTRPKQNKTTATRRNQQQMWRLINPWFLWLIGIESESHKKPWRPNHHVETRHQPTTVKPNRRNISTAPAAAIAEAKSSSSPSLAQCLFWIGGSIFIRIGLDMVLMAYPMLWPPAIALVVTPAAIAIYRTVIDSQVSFLLGRRLILIMIGLLIGGRLS